MLYVDARRREGRADGPKVSVVAIEPELDAKVSDFPFVKLWTGRLNYA
jgi:hypothetical protein